MKRQNNPYFIGAVNNKSFYFDFDSGQILLSSQKNNGFLGAILGSLAATFFGGWLRIMGGRIVIDSLLFRVILLIVVYFLMAGLATFLSKKLHSRISFNIIKLDKSELQELVNTAQRQVIAWQIFRIILIILIVFLIIALLLTPVMVPLFIFMLLILVVEWLNRDYSVKIRKGILIELRRKI